MGRTVPKAFGERMASQIGMTAAVDPEAFRDFCVEYEVWDQEDFTQYFDEVIGEFGDDATSAMHRFLDVAVCMNDGTLAEFQCSTDEGGVVTPLATFEAAAMAPLDEDSFIDRREWFEGIARRLAARASAD